MHLVLLILFDLISLSESGIFNVGNIRMEIQGKKRPNSRILFENIVFFTNMNFFQAISSQLEKIQYKYCVSF